MFWFLLWNNLVHGTYLAFSSWMLAVSELDYQFYCLYYSCIVSQSFCCSGCHYHCFDGFNCCSVLPMLCFVLVAFQLDTTWTHLPKTQLWCTDFSLSMDPCITYIWASQSKGGSCEGICKSVLIYKYPHHVSTLLSLIVWPAHIQHCKETKALE